MKEFLIVETRDAADQRGPERMARLAAGLSRGGVKATILLAENGVFSARRGGDGLAAAMRDGVAVAVDRFALEERAVRSESLAEGVAAATVDLVVDRLAAGACVIWR